MQEKDLGTLAKSTGSVFQTTNGYHQHAIFPLESILPCSSQHHEERRDFHLGDIDFIGEPQKGLNPFLYQSVATQLDFDKPIRAIAQMYHRVALQSVLVTVMIYIAVQGVRIGAQVPDAHRLKQQPERVEVGQQIFWPEPQGRYGYVSFGGFSL